MIRLAAILVQSECLVESYYQNDRQRFYFLKSSSDCEDRIESAESTTSSASADWMGLRPARGIKTPARDFSDYKEYPVCAAADLSSRAAGIVDNKR